MKGYRFAIPILLIALMVYSTYSLVETNIENKEKYQKYVEKAQEYSRQGIVVDSLDYYKKAISMIDSAAIRIEVADMLIDNNHQEECVEWLETAVEEYPTSPEVYEKLLEEYINSEQYEESYELVEEIENRELVTDNIKKLYSKIKYKFDLALDRYEEAQTLGDGYFAVGNNGKKGLLHGTKRILFGEFEYIGGFHDELISVSLDGEKYYVDSDGNKRKVPPDTIKCEYLGDICNGLISVKQNGRFSFYNKEFEKQFGDYEYASNFNEGIAAVKQNGRWYLIDTKGEKISNESYDDIKCNERNISFSNGRAFVKKEDEYQMVDKNGKKISEATYENAKNFEEKDSYAAVQIGGTWTFVDKNGKRIIKANFDDAQSFTIGIGAVKKDGLWGYVDKNGKMVIDNIFRDVKPFSKEGHTIVSDEEGWIVMSLYRFMD